MTLTERARLRSTVKRAPVVRCIGALAIAIVLTPSARAADDDELQEVILTGTRIQRAGLETPTPVTTVTSTDLQDMNPRQMIEGLSQLPQFTNNQRPQNNAPLFSGGSNLNLRGAGPTRTLVLLNGRRLPNGNRYGAVDVSTLPEAAISTVETVTGGASAAYGTDAVAGVVNFILDTRYNGFQGKAQIGTTARRDGDNYSLGFTWGHDLGERAHLLLSADYYDQDAIWSLEALQERHWFKQRALVTDPTGQYSFITRDYVRPTNTAPGGIINAPGTPLDKLLFIRTGAGTIATTPLPFNGVGRLNGGCNCYADSQRDPTWGIDADNAIQQANGRQSAFAYVDYDVTDNTNVYFQGIYGLSKVKGPWFTVPTLVGGAWGATIFSGNPYLPANVQQIMTANKIASVGFGETGLSRNDKMGGLGLYVVDQSDELTAATLGFTSKFASNWKASAYAQFGANHQDMDFQNGLITSNLFLALDAVTNPATGKPACRAALVNPQAFGNCVPVNLFGGVDSVSPEARDYLLDPHTHVKSDYHQVFSELVLNGPVFHGIGAGDFLMAVGASYRRDDLRQWKSDLHDEFVYINGVNTGFRGLIPENQPNGMPGVRAGSVPPGYTGNSSLSNVLFTGSIQTPDTVLEGDFSVKEAFTEFDLPLLKDKPFARQLDTNLAYRWATYTGSGSISSWKYGLSWQMIDSLRLRATKSRDVRAANIRERFDATAGGATVTDPANGGVLIQTSSRTGGNPNVDPEKADTVTFGLVWQLQSFQASVDWYDIDISGALGQITQQNLVNQCYQGATQLCQYVIRDPSTNAIIRIDSLFLNLANQRIRGTDVEIRFDRPVELFGGNERFGARVFVNHLSENSTQVPGAARDFLSLEQPEWRVLSSLTYSNGAFRTFLQGRWLDGHTLNRTYNTGLPGALTVDDNTVPSVFYTDLNLSYDTAWGGQKLRFFGNVTNLLDRAPPQTPAVIGTGGTAQPNAFLYDTIGRTYAVGFNVSF
jgi:outer membrane receptor protein involved in Fe transport